MLSNELGLLNRDVNGILFLNLGGVSMLSNELGLLNRETTKILARLCHLSQCSLTSWVYLT